MLCVYYCPRTISNQLGGGSPDRIVGSRYLQEDRKLSGYFICAFSDLGGLWTYHSYYIWVQRNLYSPRLLQAIYSIASTATGPSPTTIDELWRRALQVKFLRVKDLARLITLALVNSESEYIGWHTLMEAGGGGFGIHMGLSRGHVKLIKSINYIAETFSATTVTSEEEKVQEEFNLNQCRSIRLDGSSIVRSLQIGRLLSR